MGSSNDICSLFNSYLPNHETSMHEITWIMCPAQLQSSSKKNQLKWISEEGVMPFTNQVILSSREFRPFGSPRVRPDPYLRGPDWFGWTWTCSRRVTLTSLHQISCLWLINNFLVKDCIFYVCFSVFSLFLFDYKSYKYVNTSCSYSLLSFFPSVLCLEKSRSFVWLAPSYTSLSR